MHREIEIGFGEKRKAFPTIVVCLFVCFFIVKQARLLIMRMKAIPLAFFSILIMHTLSQIFIFMYTTVGSIHVGVRVFCLRELNDLSGESSEFSTIAGCIIV